MFTHLDKLTVTHMNFEHMQVALPMRKISKLSFSQCVLGS